MKRLIALGALILTGACAAPERHPSGCPILYSDFGRQYTQSCLAAYNAERARQNGATVTTCTDNGSGFTCVTE